MTSLWSLYKTPWCKRDRIAWKLVCGVVLTSSLVGATGAWAAQVSPSALSFSAVQGGVAPTPQTVNYSKSGKREKSWTASANQAWVSMTPLSGTIATETDPITISVNTTGLTAGTHTATVTIQLQGTRAQEYTTLPITVVISGGSTGTPLINVTPTSLSFSGVVGEPNPAGQTIAIANSGGGTLSWTASDDAGWLSLTPVAGTNGGTVSAAITVGGLAAGTYTGSITISETGGGTKNVPVTLVLTAPATGSVTLSWLANEEADLAGYKIYRGTVSGNYGSPIAVLDKGVTSHTLSALESGTTYFFVITAYDDSGNESAYSNEVSKSIY